MSCWGSLASWTGLGLLLPPCPPGFSIQIHKAMLNCLAPMRRVKEKEKEACMSACIKQEGKPEKRMPSTSQPSSCQMRWQSTHNTHHQIQTAESGGQCS